MRGLKTQPLLGSARLVDLHLFISSSCLAIDRSTTRIRPTSAEIFQLLPEVHKLLPNYVLALAVEVEATQSVSQLLNYDHRRAVVKVRNTHHRIDKGNKLRRWNLFNRPFLSSGAKKAVRNEFSIIK